MEPGNKANIVRGRHDSHHNTEPDVLLCKCVIRNSVRIAQNSTQDVYPVNLELEIPYFSIPINYFALNVILSTRSFTIMK